MTRSWWVAALLAFAACGDSGSKSDDDGGSSSGGGGSSTTTYSNGHPVTWTTTDPTVISYEDQILSLVNNQRASIGVGALTHLPLMREVARGHCVHMTQGSHDFFAHTNPEGDGPTQRYGLAGGSGGCGENIAAGYSTPTSAFNGWMGSPGHKANIENAGYTKTGVGYWAGPSWGHYWTQMFQ
jgi:uncharacterized protein YkwD